jgi:diaminohydroxyphosphoribosylaminopyrimidine deaminase/5-amino-6-(5-phosphoribosylamino)uracil reductase
VRRRRGDAADEAWMERALALARRGLGRTHPNPPVGAVFVRGGRVLGEGFHRRAGAPHAEIEALRAAASAVRGADLFVTLEPCSHAGRTPPCAAALRDLGLRRVVAAMVDPNPRVRGRGVRLLRAAGVPVEVGPGAAAAAELTAGYRSWLARGRPLVTLKLAASLDGRIATAAGHSRWITAAPARRHAHGLRDVSDAVLVGAETVRHDDPRLTCRLRGGSNPIRVVLAGPGLRLPRGAAVFGPEAPTWVFTSCDADPRRAAALERRGVEVVRLPSRGGRVPFARVAQALGVRGITSVLIEGGGMVAAAALRAGSVDRVVWYAAPLLLGGDARAAVGALGATRVGAGIRLRNTTIAQVGADLVLTADVAPGHGRRPFASPRGPR